MRRAPASLRRFAALAAILIVALLSHSAPAVTHLKRGVAAPRVVLKDLNGREVDTAAREGRTLILIFGELFHDRTLAACRQIQTLLLEKEHADQAIEPLLIVAQDAKPEDLRDQGVKARISFAIVHDPKRQAFGDYRVAVLPSVVIVDGRGRIVHAMAGLTDRLADLIGDSLRYAGGKLSLERFEASVNPAPTTAPSETEVRAQRLTQLARQLARRGLDDMAGEKLAEALKVSPASVEARVELGLLHLKRRRLAEAETQFRAVLHDRPALDEAELGLAFVQTLRGGEELVDAQRRVRQVLARSPLLPRAHYLLGLIHESAGRPQEAAAAFKQAAQLLLERPDVE